MDKIIKSIFRQHEWEVRLTASYFNIFVAGLFFGLVVAGVHKLGKAALEFLLF